MSNERLTIKSRKRRNSKVANRESSLSFDLTENHGDESCRRPSIAADKAIATISVALNKCFDGLSGRQESILSLLKCQLQQIKNRGNYAGFGSSHQEVDAVLDYVYYSLSDTSYFREKLRHSALSNLIRDFDSYVPIFGKLIPEELSHAAIQRREELAFDHNHNDLVVEDWPIYRKRLEQYRNRSSDLTGVSTGLKELDRATNGLEGLTLFGGDRGIGKSALALFMATRAIRQSKDVSAIYYSLDMPKERQYDRLLCMESGLDYRELKSRKLGTKGQTAIRQADLQLQELVLPRLRIVSNQSFDQRKLGLASQVIEDIQRLQNKTNTGRTLIVIDRLQDLPILDELSFGEDPDCYRLEQLGQVQSATATPVDPYGSPMLVVCDVRKSIDTQRRLFKEDLLGTSQLISKASCILLMWPRERRQNDEAGVAAYTLEVAKGREGVARDEIDISFDWSHYIFKDAPEQAAYRPHNPLADNPRRVGINPIAAGKTRRKNAK